MNDNEKPALPTSPERLAELGGLLEEMGTGGNTQLTLDQATDIYNWLEWAAARAK